MVNTNVDEFLKKVDVKFAGQTPPNGPEDRRRLTVGFDKWAGTWCENFTLFVIMILLYVFNA